MKRHRFEKKNKNVRSCALFKLNSNLTIHEEPKPYNALEEAN